MNKHNNSILSNYRGLPKDVYVLALGKMVNCIGSFIHPLLSLILTKKLGFSIGEAGLFVTLTAFLQTPCIILGGKLVDTIGPRKVIIYFQSLAAIILIICGLIPPTHSLAYLLIISSCLSSVSQSCYEALVSNITNPKNRKSSFSLIYMGLNLGIAIGPALGGFLFNKYLSFLFIGDGITTLISILLVVLFIKESDYKSLVHERPALEAEVKGSVFKIFKQRPIILLYSLCMLTFSFAYTQWGFAVPVQLQSQFGSDVGPSLYGLLSSFNGFIVILLTPVITSLTSHKKILSVIAFGGFLYALSFGFCGFANTKLLYFIIIFVITVGEIAISINSSTFIANCTPASHRGRINSIIPLISGTGYAFGPLVMGNLLSSYGTKVSWLIVGAVAGIGAISIYLLNFMKISRD